MRITFLLLMSLICACVSGYMHNMDYVGLSIWFYFFSLVCGLGAISISVKILIDNME